MPASRTFALVDAATKKQVGSITLDEATLPGELVVRFRRDEFHLEAVSERPMFTGRAGGHGERSKKKPA